MSMQTLETWRQRGAVVTIVATYGDTDFVISEDRNNEIRIKEDRRQRGAEFGKAESSHTACID